jgi:hypothetical protein
MSKSEKMKTKFSKFHKASRITEKSKKDLYDAEEESENDSCTFKESTIRRIDPTKRKSMAPNRYGDSDSGSEEEETGLHYLVEYLPPFAGKFSVVTGNRQIKSNKFDDNLASVLERGIHYDVKILRMGISEIDP